jgi:hypothetical protein
MILLSLTDSSSRVLTGGKEGGSVAVEEVMMVRVKFQIEFEFLRDKIRNSRNTSISVLGAGSHKSANGHVCFS